MVRAILNDKHLKLYLKDLYELNFVINGYLYDKKEKYKKNKLKYTLYFILYTMSSTIHNCVVIMRELLDMIDKLDSNKKDTNSDTRQ